MIFGLYHPQEWNFDVSSLMVLISEGEELNYRLSQRSLVQSIVALPVVGLQSYIRSYDLLLKPGTLTYFSPYRRKSAPLRNVALENAIRLNGLLKDGTYRTYRVPQTSTSKSQKSRVQPSDVFMWTWVGCTWLCFGGLLAFLVLIPSTTWIGMTNCVVLSAWSILLRTLEFFMVQPAPVSESITDPDKDDAIFILGRDNSALVLEGSRYTIKEWTTRGLVYRKDDSLFPAGICQVFTRIGSFLVLLLVFSTIPNGTTMDQVAFIIQNALAQVNVLVGQWLNSICLLNQLENSTNIRADTRTHIYGLLLRKFKDLGNEWVASAGLLPQTDVWREWESLIVKDIQVDPKELYNTIQHRQSGTSR